MHRYAILAWSVAIACWFAAGLLAQQLHGPNELTTDSSSVTTTLSPNGLLTFHPHTATSVLPTSHAALFYGGLSAAWAVLVWLVATGANWARITQTALGVIGGVVVLVQAASALRGSGPGAIVPGWLDVVALLAIAAAILAIYRPAANAYFARRPLGAPRPAPLLPRPLVVTRAAWLFSIAAVLDIVAQFVRVLLPVVPPSTPALTGVAVAGSSWPGAVGSVTAVLFSVAVQVLLIVFLLRAANWARVLQTVVTAVAVVYLPFGLILTANLTLAPGVVVTWAFSLVLIVLQIVAIVLLYRPVANAFFAAGTGISLEGGPQTS